MSRPFATLTAIAALAIALTGCAQTPVERMHLPHPTPTAAFASEEEALAAAVETYGRYVLVGDEVGRNGGEGAERMAEVVTGDFLDGAIEGFAKWVDKGWHQVGERTFRDVVLQQASVSRGEVVVYLCDDVSAIDVVDRLGVSVVSPDRPDTNHMQVEFGTVDGSLRLTGRQRWDEIPC